MSKKTVSVNAGKEGTLVFLTADTKKKLLSKGVNNGFRSLKPYLESILIKEAEKK